METLERSQKENTDKPVINTTGSLAVIDALLSEKVDTIFGYPGGAIMPIYDALYDFMDGRMVERALQTGMIEVAPLAFMRGRTLSNACILLDEAQNATSMQMKMFLTRLGEGSCMIATGDISQTDLPRGQESGLSEAVRILASVEGIELVRFSSADVVRHELVRRIVDAYEKAPRPDGSVEVNRR